MRYYSIIITDANGKLIRPQSLASANMPFTWGSYLNGQTLGGAQNVELNIPVTIAHQPTGDAFVRICGISVAEIAQSFDLNGMNIVVSGGMQKGLPLAKPQQSGPLVQGFVFQCLGNWVGTDMTLDLQIKSGPAPIATPSVPYTPPPLNIVLNWLKGTPLSQAIAQTLATAYPGVKQVINISPNLVSTDTQVGFYTGLDEFSEWLNQISMAIIGKPTYQGVGITLWNNALTVDDGTVKRAPTMLAFEDMIGQPTWLDTQTIQTKFAMRADLSVYNYIQFPQAIATRATNVNSPYGIGNQNLTFQGVYQISRVVHYGDFRQPDASSWVTVVDAYPQSS